MKFKELANMSKEEREAKMSELELELIKLNAQVATGTPPKNAGQLKRIKKDIARMMLLKSTSQNIAVKATPSQVPKPVSRPVSKTTPQPAPKPVTKPSPKPEPALVPPSPPKSQSIDSLDKTNKQKTKEKTTEKTK